MTKGDRVCVDQQVLQTITDLTEIHILHKNTEKVTTYEPK